MRYFLLEMLLKFQLVALDGILCNLPWILTCRFETHPIEQRAGSLSGGQPHGGALLRVSVSCKSLPIGDWSRHWGQIYLISKRELEDRWMRENLSKSIRECRRLSDWKCPLEALSAAKGGHCGKLVWACNSVTLSDHVS